MTAEGQYQSAGFKRWLLVECKCGCSRGPFQVFANASPANAGNLQYKMQPHAGCFAEARAEHARKGRKGTFTRNVAVLRDSRDWESVGRTDPEDESTPFFVDLMTQQPYRRES
jgi:hypothetical protein